MSKYPIVKQDRYTKQGSFVSGNWVDADCSPAFFTAMNSCVVLDPLPHPIRGRNANLVAAWSHWRLWLDQVTDVMIDDEQRHNPASGFEPCVAGLLNTIKSDPVWQSGRFGFTDLRVLTVLASASLLFWRNRSMLIEPTAPLEHLLIRSDLGADVPIDLLRPPAPACYICFGKLLLENAVLPGNLEGVDPYTLEGVYVFESRLGDFRRLSLIPVYGIKNRQRAGANTIDIVIADEEQSLLDVLRDICKGYHANDRPHYEWLMQTCAMLFLYQSLKPEQCLVKMPYAEAMTQLQRVGPKKAAKLYRHVTHLYDRIIVGPESLPEMRGEISPHWRRGHFRLQTYGPRNSLRKPMFIAPTLVRADRLVPVA